ncbi:MAG TPA: DUF4296 domain-containing protein [Bacteroidales bacterium]|nr:DUF4296 domain-containing protein [Bacteroidales bacterium]HOH22752.1 DUF4296 domain-containing protein [Bacteroidales bacterium]HPB57621.1 DUF4296 domain-containing protein [Bacteroidales bacterium]HPZ03090.1 DUF4296 domain-containing protein [Bacteroidales bacterium]HQB74712.1 DUF4296 domain-containing protein [Bacteroidales bacterium]
MSAGKLKIGLVFLLIPFLFMNGCQKKKVVPPPPDLIPYDSMVVILEKTFIVESIVYYTPPDSDRLSVTRALYADLFNQYGITKEQYISSINYYLAEKSRAEQLLRDVTEKINETKSKLIPEDEANRFSE